MTSTKGDGLANMIGLAQRHKDAVQQSHHDSQLNRSNVH